MTSVVYGKRSTGSEIKVTAGKDYSPHYKLVHFDRCVALTDRWD